MITGEVCASIFDARADAIVVTVNTVGDMGAGLALDARLRFPEMAEAYKQKCEDGCLDIGKLWLWRHSHPQLLCFPTKRHWRQPSRIDYIRAGLAKLVETYRQRGLCRLAVPHLGADRGGLDWHRTVRPIVYDTLGPLQDLEVVLYGYDPTVPERLFEQLRTALDSLTVDGFAERAGLRRREAELVHRTVVGATHRNMSVLHDADGIGIRTLERVYDFGRRVSEEPRQQMLPLD